MRYRNKIKTKYFISLALALIPLAIGIYHSFLKTHPVCSGVSVSCMGFNMQIYTPQQLIDQLNQKQKLEGTELSRINLNALKEYLMQLPWIKDIRLFFTMNNKLEILFYYAIPVAKLYDPNAGDYRYLNNKARILPKIPGLVVYVPTVLCSFRDKMLTDSSDRKHLVSFIHQIKAHAVWNKLYSFIEVAAPTGIIVHIRKRNQKIIIGNLKSIMQKIRRFDVFYRNFLKRNKKLPGIIDLRFKNIVVTR